MRTPPTTRTKEDATKELHEIELEINKEKDMLARIKATRAEAEVAFELRENKFKERESKIDIDEEKFKQDAEGRKRTIEFLDSEIADKTARIKYLDKQEEENRKYREDCISKRDQEFMELSEQIIGQRKFIDSTDIDIAQRRGDLAKLDQQLIELKNRHKEEEERLFSLAQELDDRGREQDERETMITNKMSDLRVYTNQLRRLYGDKLDKVAVGGLIE